MTAVVIIAGLSSLAAIAVALLILRRADRRLLAEAAAVDSVDAHAATAVTEWRYQPASRLSDTELAAWRAFTATFYIREDR